MLSFTLMIFALLYRSSKFYKTIYWTCGLQIICIDGLKIQLICIRLCSEKYISSPWPLLTHFFSQRPQLLAFICSYFHTCTNMYVQACLGDNSMLINMDFLTFNSYTLFNYLHYHTLLVTKYRSFRWPIVFVTSHNASVTVFA